MLFVSVADPDPGSGDFLSSGSGSEIQTLFLLSKLILETVSSMKNVGLILYPSFYIGFGIWDEKPLGSGSGMKNHSDPGF
jgi:hypothetical protein